jgi:hypothetical protein
VRVERTSLGRKVTGPQRGAQRFEQPLKLGGHRLRSGPGDARFPKRPECVERERKRGAGAGRPAPYRIERGGARLGQAPEKGKRQMKVALVRRAAAGLARDLERERGERAPLRRRRDEREEQPRAGAAISR